MGRVDGKVAVVTGGARGIGRAASLLLAREGARVAVTDVREDEARRVAGRIAEHGGTGGAWRLDVTDEAEVERVLREVVERWGRLDVLVNNAGIAGSDRPPHELPREDWSRVMEVDVTGVFLCTKHAVPHLRRAGGGSVVNLSSIYGLVGAPDVPPYHAAKGAVRAMTKTDALFYAADGIRVNSVHPGFVRTAMVERYLETLDDRERGERELAKRHPLGRIGDPEDVAYGILYLASDESGFVTGSELVIDGGYTAR